MPSKRKTCYQHLLIACTLALACSPAHPSFLSPVKWLNPHCCIKKPLRSVIDASALEQRQFIDSITSGSLAATMAKNQVTLPEARMHLAAEIITIHSASLVCGSCLVGSNNGRDVLIEAIALFDPVAAKTAIASTNTAAYQDHFQRLLNNAHYTASQGTGSQKLLNYLIRSFKHFPDYAKAVLSSEEFLVKLHPLDASLRKLDRPGIDKACYRKDIKQKLQTITREFNRDADKNLSNTYLSASDIHSYLQDYIAGLGKAFGQGMVKQISPSAHQLFDILSKIEVQRANKSDIFTLGANIQSITLEVAEVCDQKLKLHLSPEEKAPLIRNQEGNLIYTPALNAFIATWITEVDHRGKIISPLHK